ncbi:MAG: PEP-utilizing enzyme [Myxococcota bacterium]
MSEKTTTLVDEPTNVLHQHCGPDVDWSRVNTAESIVGVQTPLSWSFWDEGGERGFRLAYCGMGLLPSAERAIPSRVDEQFTALFYGRGATNVSAFRRALDALPFAATDDAEASFFSSRGEAARMRASRGQRVHAAVLLPAVALGLPRRLARLRTRSRAAWSTALAALPNADGPAAHACFERALPRFAEEVAAQIVASTVATILFGRLQRLAARVGEAERANELLGGFGEMEEVRTSADLWAVAHGALPLERFLARHGFRGPADGELSNASWREDPRPVEMLLPAYRALPDERRPDRAEATRAAARARAADELLAALRGRERRAARVLLALGRRYIPLRVVAKAAFQQTFDVARAAARRMGALHARSGRLADAADVFYLTREELLEPPPDARARVAERRALRARYAALELPVEFRGMPEPFVPETAEARSTEETGATPRACEGGAGRAALGDATPVTGLGVSSGVVEGVARVVLEPGDDELLPGEILVCRTTDPSWSAYFMLAAGVVIDIGGPLSHGAIVARELGIPCVINTIDGTRRIRSGERIRVDGGAGRVERSD